MFDIPDDYKPEKYMTTAQVEETTQYLINHPLFMNELPQDPSSNPHLTALQNLIFDQDPQEVANHFNKKGNELVKEHPKQPYYMKSALKSYTQGIQAHCSDPGINSKLRSNRAFVHMFFKNYGRAAQDCREALQQNPSFIKPRYRLARCLTQTGRLSEAIQQIQCCLKIDPSSSQLKAFKKQVQARLQKQQRNLIQVEQKRNKQQSTFLQYVLSKGYKLKPHNSWPSTFQFCQGKLLSPISFLYPQFQASDFVQKAAEESSLEDHLDLILSNGLPYGQGGSRYLPGNVALFVELDRDRIRRVPTEMRVSEVLAIREWIGAIQINVVQKSRVEFYAGDRRVI